MKKKTIAITCAGLAVAATGVVLWINGSDPRDLEEPPPVTSGRDDPAAGAVQPKPAKPPVDPRVPGVFPRGNVPAGIAQMAKVIRERFAGRLDTLYGDFYATLNPFVADELKQLQLDQRLWMMERTGAGEHPTMEEFMRQNRVYEGSIKELLGSSGYEGFRAARASEGDIMTTEKFQQALAEKGISLPPEKAGALKEILIANRERVISPTEAPSILDLPVPGEPGTPPSGGTVPGMPAYGSLEELMAEFKEKRKGINANILAETDELLTDEEREILGRILKEQEQPSQPDAGSSPGRGALTPGFPPL